MTKRSARPLQLPGDRGLGAHHFAYLRAFAEGVATDEAARRYLGKEHGAELRGLHQLVVDRARAIARRRGDSRWRLIGLEIDDAPADTTSAPGAGAPPIDEWAEAEGLDDWSQEEAESLYFARFPIAMAVDESAACRQARNVRLRQRRLDLLRKLAEVAGAGAAATDLSKDGCPLILRSSCVQSATSPWPTCRRASTGEGVGVQCFAPMALRRQLAWPTCWTASLGHRRRRGRGRL